MAIAVRHPAGPLTYDEVQQLPDDGLRYELVDGELLVTPAPAAPHQLCVVNLIYVLGAACPDHLRVLPAPVDWYVDELTYFEPDLIVVRRDQIEGRRIEATPLLAVEVLSPTTRRRDQGLKKRAYEDAGLGCYWIVDPDEPCLTAYHLADGRYVEDASVTGHDRYDAAAPFPVSVVPAELLR